MQDCDIIIITAMTIKLNLTWQYFAAIEADVMEASDTLLWRCCSRYDKPETP